MSKLLKPKILVVDDEPDICELLSMLLQRMNTTPVVAHDLESAKQQLKDHTVDLVLTDLNLKINTGLQIVNYLTESYPTIPCAVITAHGDVETAVEALKAGAFDFILKPIEFHKIEQLLNTGLKLSKTHNWTGDNMPQIVGTSKVFQRLRQFIAVASSNDLPVLLLGPTGSGKTLAAKTIYQQSERVKKSLYTININTISHDNLHEALFGSVTEQGFLLQANGATLLLHGIDVLPLELQSQLAEIMKTKRLTSNHETIALDIKYLFISNQNLEKLVNKKLFRQELFYLINVLTFTLPALATITSDFDTIKKYILDKLTMLSERPQPHFSDAAVLAMKNYHFPGNVRELEAVLQRALALAGDQQIHIDDLQLAPLSNDVIIDNQCSLPNQLEEVEKQKILIALENNNGNKTATAKALGISFRALRYRLKKLQIN